MNVTIIPFYMIETGEARREFNTFATEHSVLYHFGMDWVYYYRTPGRWCLFGEERRN